MTDITPLPLTAEAETTANPTPDDERLWSVTTIIKAIGSDEGLIHWSADETAKAAIRSEKTWRAIQEESGDAEAIAWLAQARFKGAKGERSATKLGSAVHTAIEQWIVNGTRPTPDTSLGEYGFIDDEVVPYLDMFDRFLDRFQPTFEAAEMTVYHPGYGYAGTLDGIATIEGTRVIIDYKTAKQSFDGRGNRKKPWADVALQLAAYRHAEFAAVWRARRYEKYSRRYYLLSQEERALAVPVPATDGGLVVHLTPDHCDVYPVECGDEVHTAFLYAIEAARWSYEMSKGVIGSPIALMDKEGN